MDDTHVPAVLKAEAQWICWRTESRDGTPTKVPIDPHTGAYASVTNAATWSDYATARAYYRETSDVDGVGFVFTADDPYAGVDLDACRNPATGDIDDWVVEILRRLDSYTERSPSGTGFHVYVVGEVPAGGNRCGNLELYDRSRYFTVTGDRVPGAPTTVAERADELRAIHDEYIADVEDAPAEGDAAADAAEPATDPVAPEEYAGSALTDEELLEKAMTAANGETFRALWRGDTAGYPSHSEADLALCSLLAFWTGGDPQRIEALFGQSGLVREKWRERPDYRERTIRTAIRTCSAFYTAEGNDYRQQ